MLIEKMIMFFISSIFVAIGIYLHIIKNKLYDNIRNKYPKSNPILLTNLPYILVVSGILLLIITSRY